MVWIQIAAREESSYGTHRHWSSHSRFDLLINRQILFDFEGHRQAIGYCAVKSLDTIALAMDTQPEYITVLKSRDGILGFQHFMLHRATQHLIVIRVHTI